MSDLYIYADASLTRIGRLIAPELANATERHKVQFEPPDLQPSSNPARELEESGAAGIVIGLVRGLPGLGNIRFASNILSRGRKVFFHWPAENAVEVIDREQLRSYWHLWYVASLNNYALRYIPRPWARNSEIVKLLWRVTCEIAEIRKQPKPVPIHVDFVRQRRGISGTGVYLRTDFWAPITSGGSYGHTCYVAKGLAQVSDGLVCFLPHRYPLLDEFGIHQVVLPPVPYQGEPGLLRASSFYMEILRTAIKAVRPAYIYERLCLGNYCGAQLSQDLNIPYIVEYNGSEVSMSKSFGGTGYIYEGIYLEAEDAAFRQATLVSVVSEAIKEDLLKRGVPESKIHVNPNAADIEAYKPPEKSVKAEIRRQFGWNGYERVIGFTGTFGGWHGIEVLSKAIPEICRRVPEARFLLIGDGNYKNVVDHEVALHNLNERVISTGRVPQQEGARLLGACDIYVSPHSRNMVNGKFFGSPTKIFEYMAMGGGIVASDLEQIGEVLSPAVHTSTLTESDFSISNERSVLCQSGSVDEFVTGVEYLARNPSACEQLGRNARQAVVENHTWDRHIDRLLAALAESRDFTVQAETEQTIKTGDVYKNEAQQQWDNDPCGSHYVEESEPRTLDWFLGVESYRYSQYAPWMPETMEFNRHAGEDVLEIGAGIGTDLAQFARHGARVTDIDLSRGHLAHAQENFRARGLTGRFIHMDAEQLPFPDGTFDLVYTNGVIHHSPNTSRIVSEIYRVLRPGAKVIAMVYAENSWNYWLQLVFQLGISAGLLDEISMGEIMSRHVELGTSGARPLVKVYTKKRLRKLFRGFSDIDIVQRQLTAPELPSVLRKVLPLPIAGKLMGWNLILKGRKPRSS